MGVGCWHVEQAPLSSREEGDKSLWLHQMFDPLGFLSAQKEERFMRSYKRIIEISIVYLPLCTLLVQLFHISYLCNILVREAKKDWESVSS
jgi:hypothetical protein